MSTAVSPDALRAETVTISGHGGDQIEAYLTTPPREPGASGVAR